MPDHVSVFVKEHKNKVVQPEISFATKQTMWKMGKILWSYDYFSWANTHQYK